MKSEPAASSAVRIPPAPGARRSWSGLAARLGLLAASLLLALLVGELVVRALSPRARPGTGHFYEADPELGYRLRPGFDGRFSDQADFDTRVRTNAAGLRGPEVRGDRPGLLGLGDSFLFGYGVEEDETFLKLAADRLGLEPLNAGAPAYGVDRAATLGARLLPLLRPRIVLLAVFLGNDEVDSAPGRVSFAVRDGALVAKEAPRSPLRRLTRALYRRCHLVRLALDRAGNPRAVVPILEPYLDPPGPDVLAGDQVIAIRVAALARSSRDHDARLVVLLLPEKLEVVGGELERIAARAGLVGARFERDGPRARVSSAVASAGVVVLDARPAILAAVGRGERPYFRRDRHFSPEGHRIVADLLVRALAPDPARHP